MARIKNCPRDPGLSRFRRFHAIGDGMVGATGFEPATLAPTEVRITDTLLSIVTLDVTPSPKWLEKIELSIGAGRGNRTLVFSLEGCCSTIELHPRN